MIPDLEGNCAEKEENTLLFLPCTGNRTANDEPLLYSLLEHSIIACSSFPELCVKIASEQALLTMLRHVTRKTVWSWRSPLLD